MIKKANKKIAKRYLKKLKKADNFGEKETSKKHIISMLKMMLKTKDFTEDKHSRWLGYIQGVLICYKIINVNEERKITRKIYQKIYKSKNIKQKKLSASKTKS